MREILFRGKRTDNGEWIQGYLFKIWESAYILLGTINGIPDMVEVIPATVGQYTGHTDKNDTMIFEGDIVYGENYLLPCYDARKLTVYWHDDCAGFRMNIFNASDVEVVGNIHDKSELLESAE